jgi:hypothetical protein
METSDLSLKSSGSKLTASAVERTSPHDSTFSCRFSGGECGAALPWPGVPAGMASPRLDRLNCSGSMAGGASPFRGALRPYIEFISDAWHREDESWRLRVRLYLASQAGDEHIDATIIGFRATPGNSVTELITRQYLARTVYECGQQRDLGAGQPHFPAAAIDKGMAGQVELAVIDFYRRSETRRSSLPRARAAACRSVILSGSSPSKRTIRLNVSASHST